METRHDKLRRLVSRVCAGEVVFFIGAGFSVDSEGNTAKLLIARLLARFEALAEWFEKTDATDARSAAQQLRNDLRVTFSLKDSARRQNYVDLFDDTERPGGRPSVLSEVLTTLSQNYYLINDWMCQAFESLVDRLPAGAASSCAAEVNHRENALLKIYAKPPAIHHIDLAPIDVEWLSVLRNDVVVHPVVPPERFVCGKALFLETLGFANDAVMGGRPLTSCLDDVASSAAGRVRLRHHVLSWLAAEGLCPTLVTTNYDLLLDCSHRLAGLLPLAPHQELWGGPDTPQQRAEKELLPLNRRYRHFARIADASQFFTHGDAYESAVIHKIHGCVEAYRLARQAKDPERFRKALRTIVFTFREIQNWREDSWSRDHLTTLLRTHTIVFAGYSGADQVIHDTFRTVYEEIARYRAGAGRAAESGLAPGSNARAFFADLDEAGSFHGVEILRAASIAAGDPNKDVTGHPNLLTFFTGQSPRRFPTVDDLFAWTYHLVARELQAQALAAEISGIAYQLFRRRRPNQQATAIVNAFALLRAAEHEEASTFDEGSDPAREPDVRRRFERLTKWTTVFSTALMREYQLADSLLSHPTDGHPISEIARYPWYRPLSEHPQWAAWNAILEIAIRRVLAWHVGQPDAWLRSTSAFAVIEDTCPTVQFVAERGDGAAMGSAVKRALSIEVAMLRDRFARHEPRRLFAAREPVVWSLQPGTLPWWSQTDTRRPADTPAADRIWLWAAFGTGDWQHELTELLGGTIRGDEQAV